MLLLAVGEAKSAFIEKTPHLWGVQPHLSAESLYAAHTMLLACTWMQHVSNGDISEGETLVHIYAAKAASSVRIRPQAEWSTSANTRAGLFAYSNSYSARQETHRLALEANKQPLAAARTVICWWKSGHRGMSVLPTQRQGTAWTDGC